MIPSGQVAGTDMNKDQLRSCELCELNVEFDERPSMPALDNVTEAECRTGTPTLRGLASLAKSRMSKV